MSIQGLQLSLFASLIFWHSLSTLANHLTEYEKLQMLCNIHSRSEAFDTVSGIDWLNPIIPVLLDIKLELFDRLGCQLGCFLEDDDLLQVAPEVVHPEVVEICKQIDCQDGDSKQQE